MSRSRIREPDGTDGADSRVLPLGPAAAAIPTAPARANPAAAAYHILRGILPSFRSPERPAAGAAGRLAASVRRREIGERAGDVGRVIADEVGGELRRGVRGIAQGIPEDRGEGQVD